MPTVFLPCRAGQPAETWHTGQWPVLTSTIWFSSSTGDFPYISHNLATRPQSCAFGIEMTCYYFTSGHSGVFFVNLQVEICRTQTGHLSLCMGPSRKYWMQKALVHGSCILQDFRLLYLLAHFWFWLREAVCIWLLLLTDFTVGLFHSTLLW